MNRLLDSLGLALFVLLTASAAPVVVVAVLGKARVPAGLAYTAKDIVEDPHYRSRNMILEQQTRDGYTVAVPGIVPKLLATPGSVRSSAPHLGDDTNEVLEEFGFSAQDIKALRERKVVA